LSAQQSLDDHAAKCCFEPKVTNAAKRMNACFPKNRLPVIYLGLIATIIMAANALASEAQPLLPKGRP
jgi:hypothetical protein